MYSNLNLNYFFDVMFYFLLFAAIPLLFSRYTGAKICAVVVILGSILGLSLP